MKNNQNILVEYKDGCYQWIKNALEKDLVSNNNIKRICGYTIFEVDTKKWKLGEKSQFEKIIIE